MVLSIIVISADGDHPWDSFKPVIYDVLFLFTKEIQAADPTTF